MKKIQPWMVIIPILSIFAGLNFWIKAKDSTYVPHPKISFVYDVLAPMGMPIVSKYHHVRENIFLNTASKNATGLEAAGNFFLSPSRYLFGGIDIDETGNQTITSFSYQDYWGAKTFASLITLFPGQVIGATLKGLSYLSFNTQQRHAEISKTLYNVDIEPNESLYQTFRLPRLYGNSVAPCQDHKRNSQLSTKLQIDLEALKQVCHVLDTYKIPYWADAGTLLGAYRYGGVIPWDCDIDLAMLKVDHENVKNALRKSLDPEKYEIQDWSSYANPKSFLKLFVKDSGSHIDLYHYEVDPKNQTLTFDYTWMDTPFPESWKSHDVMMVIPHSYADVFPLKKANFDGITIRVPNNTIGFLHKLYGKNLDPTMLWNEETQEYEKVEDHPYWSADNSQ